MPAPSVRVSLLVFVVGRSGRHRRRRLRVVRHETGLSGTLVLCRDARGCISADTGRELRRRRTGRRGWRRRKRWSGRGPRHGAQFWAVHRPRCGWHAHVSGAWRGNKRVLAVVLLANFPLPSVCTRWPCQGRGTALCGTPGGHKIINALSANTVRFEGRELASTMGGLMIRA